MRGAMSGAMRDAMRLRVLYGPDGGVDYQPPKGWEKQYSCLPEEVAILAVAEMLTLQVVTGVPGLQLACGLGRPDLASALVRAGCSTTAVFSENCDYSSPGWLRHFKTDRERRLWMDFRDADFVGFNGTAKEIAEQHGHVKTLAAVEWAAAQIE